MTQEEEKLLLKVLNEIMPYRAYIKKKVCHKYETEELTSINRGQITDDIFVNGYLIKKTKPYLRSMSSVTEKEMKDYWEKVVCGSMKSTEWLNSHFMDWRGLIPMGLALEAPEGMYKTE